MTGIRKESQNVGRIAQHLHNLYPTFATTQILNPKRDLELKIAINYKSLKFLLPSGAYPKDSQRARRVATTMTMRIGKGIQSFTICISEKLYNDCFKTYIRTSDYPSVLPLPDFPGSDLEVSGLI